jgi:hypothetical protein
MEDGAQRWEHAYQRLLRWSSLDETTLQPVPPEDTYENGSLCPRLDPAPKPSTNDGAPDDAFTDSPGGPGGAVAAGMDFP